MRESQAAQAGQYSLYVTHPGDILALTGFDSLYGGASGSGMAARVVEASLAKGATSITFGDGSTLTLVGASTEMPVYSS